MRGNRIIALHGGILLAVLGTLVLRTSPAEAQGIATIWAVDDGEKVRQDDLNHWAKSSPNNRVWDGTVIRLFSARNETVAFQLILQASGAGATKVNVVLDSLSGSGGTITNTGGGIDPLNYVGRRIELFVEHYTNVTQRSPFVNGYGLYESRPLPDDLHMGWIPDALVPFEAPVKVPEHGQGGAPFPIAPNKNQGVWVDIYVPEYIAAGTYRGNVRVYAGTTLVRSIPLELQVYQFSLPQETHQRSFFHWNEEFLPTRYGLVYNSAEYWDLYRDFMNMAHRHRFDLVDGHRTLDGSEGFAQRLGGYYTGAYYASQYRYEGPGVGKGNTTYSIGTYDQPTNGFVSGFTPNTMAAWQKAADAWETWFQNNAPGTLRFKYMDDEGDVTNPAVVQAIKDKCFWITSSPGPGKNLHRFFTKEYVYQGFFGYIDFWALSAPPGVRLSEVQARHPLGELFCMYNGTRPMWGNMEVIDNFATDNRVNPWICWKYGIDLLFFWTTSFYAENVPPNPTATNVWVDNYLPSGDPFGSVKAWGAGMMFYPGIDIQYPSDSRGVRGPIGCIRMKNFRRGQQDYEYLWLARQAGINVSDLVNVVVPHAVDDWGATQYTNPPAYAQQPVYATQGYIYDDARRAIAERIVQSGGIVTLPTARLDVSPTKLPVGGGSVTLTWSSSGATSATLDHGIGAIALSGSRQVNLTASTIFTAVFTNAAGSTSIQASVTVAESVITPPPDVNNIIVNPTFDNGTVPWVGFSNGQAIFQSVAPGVQSSAAGKYTLVRWGDNSQLFQSGLTLQPNSLYRLSFDAKADSSRDMDVSIIRHLGAFATYGLWAYYVSMSAQWTHYAIDFATDPWDFPVTDGRLMFRFGPYAKTGDIYWLDNVSLVKLRTLPPASKHVPPDFDLSQNFPNPFRASTIIQYALPQPGHVRLTVYDILGRQVAVLEDMDKPQGRYQITYDASSLSAGVYYCVMNAGSYTELRKMVLMR